MSMTKEKRAAANKGIKTMPIKGKNYATVATRLNEFWAVCPDGSIDTTVCDIDESHVLMQAKVYDEKDHLLATGTAEEEKEASRINSTSYVENCETSAIGRALANAGFGSEENIASAEELTNALMNQATMLPGKKLLTTYCTEHGLAAQDVLAERGITLESIPKGSNAIYYRVVADLMEAKGE